MFNFLKNLLEKASSDWQAAGASPQHWQQLGLSESQFMAVVLMLQLADADFDSSEQEHRLVLNYLRNEYGLTTQQAETVFTEAFKLAGDATCLHAFTSKLKVLSEPERLAVLDQLWQVAYADGTVDPNEEAMLRNVADLLFIKHSDFVKSKLANKPANLSE
ncbi:tellurite resistance TerB family protein [Alishewanella longhuensis]